MPTSRRSWSLGGSRQFCGGIRVWAGRIWAKPGSCRSWFRDTRSLSVRYVAEFLSFRASAQLDDLCGRSRRRSDGGWRDPRSSETLVGPLNSCTSGLRPPRSRRGPTRRPVARASAEASCNRCSDSWALGRGVWWRPAGVWSRLGPVVLGRTWLGSRSVLAPVVVAAVAESFSAGPWVGLRSLGAAKQSLRARVLFGAITVPLGVGGAPHPRGTRGGDWIGNRQLCGGRNLVGTVSTGRNRNSDEKRWVRRVRPVCRP